MLRAQNIFLIFVPQNFNFVNLFSSDKRVWETSGRRRGVLTEYPSLEAFKGGPSSSSSSVLNHSLPLPFEGNDHVVYNGSFYYYSRAREAVVAYEIATGRSTMLRLPRNAHNEGREGDMLTGYFIIKCRISPFPKFCMKREQNYLPACTPRTTLGRTWTLPPTTTGCGQYSRLA